MYDARNYVKVHILIEKAKEKHEEICEEKKNIHWQWEMCGTRSASIPLKSHTQIRDRFLRNSGNNGDERLNMTQSRLILKRFWNNDAIFSRRAPKCNLEEYQQFTTVSNIIELNAT